MLPSSVIYSTVRPAAKPSAAYRSARTAADGAVLPLDRRRSVDSSLRNHFSTVSIGERGRGHFPFRLSVHAVSPADRQVLRRFQQHTKPGSGNPRGVIEATSASSPGGKACSRVPSGRRVPDRRWHDSCIGCTRRSSVVVAVRAAEFAAALSGIVRFAVNAATKEPRAKFMAGKSEDRQRQSHPVACSISPLASPGR